MLKVLTVGVVVLLGGVVGVAVVAGGGEAGGFGSPVGGAAVGDIPPSLQGVYVEAAASCPGLPWSVLAAIGSVESGHGEGRLDAATGEVRPFILGPALNGRDGFARLPDPTSLDGWTHAQGPMQFLPSTWRRWGRLAPGRPSGATPSPHNAWDAIWTAAAYLCGSAGRVADVRAAIKTYNRSDAYVDKVLTKARNYDSSAPSAGPMPVGMVCPVGAAVRHSNDWHAPRSGGRQHQGNDLFAPAGTVLVAIEDGTVDKVTNTDTGLGGITLWIKGRSGTRWYYAHNARNLTQVGAQVTAGQPVAVLGNTGNARTTPAHVHFEIHPGGGAAANPYPFLARLCGSRK